MGIDTLCGVTTIHIVNSYVWVIDGLAPNLPYAFYTIDNDPLHLNDSSAGFGGTSDGGGYGILGKADAIAHNYANLLIHQPTGSLKTNRVSDATYSVNVLSGAVSDPGFATPGHLEGHAGDTKALLEWTVPLLCDARTTAVYKVYRSTSIGSLGSAISTQTTRQFLDTGLTNGTTYYYRIENGVTITGVEYISSLGSFNQTELTNQVAITPGTRRQYVGYVSGRM